MKKSIEILCLILTIFAFALMTVGFAIVGGAWFVAMFINEAFRKKSVK